MFNDCGFCGERILEVNHQCDMLKVVARARGQGLKAGRIQGLKEAEKVARNRAHGCEWEVSVSHQIANLIANKI